jgi:hypothetical protein
MAYEYTSPGKGLRAHRHTTTKSFRSEHERIFGRKKKGIPEDTGKNSLMSLVPGRILK